MKLFSILLMMVIQFPIVQLNRSIFWNGLIEQSKIIASAWDTKYTKTWADLGWIDFSQIPYIGITLVVGQDTSNSVDTRTIEIKSTQVTYRTFGTKVCLFAHGY